jgi:dienelactone hydrolase
MRKALMGIFAAAILAAFAAPASADPASKNIAARIEAIPVQTLTISDQQFLSGDANGRPTTIAGVLRIAQGTGRLPVVIFVSGSGGFNANTDVWDRQFLELGISTFAMDVFAGRGITSVVPDQSQLGRLNAILDVYRSLAVLAAHPRVDPSRIAVMGFSRGGQAALYASVKRFQKLWNTASVEPAAYFALYPQCTATFIGDGEVSDHPIRIFHGIPDDYNEIAPCRRYYERLKKSASDVEMMEFPDTMHAYDFPLFSTTPTVVQNGQTLHCSLVEGAIGVIINTETQQPFTFADACVGRNPHVAYSDTATRATEGVVKEVLRAKFKLR